MSELTSEANPSLSLTEDPKTSWAKAHPEFFPVDINAAARETLLRVPGIGVRNVDKILSIRKYHSLLVEDLHKLHVRLKQALPYVVTHDHLPQASVPGTVVASETAQLDLFAAYAE